MNATDANEISEWVRKGGVLLLLANDQANCDLKYFNVLASKFGFTFNDDLVLHVADDKHFPDGGLSTQDSPLFPTARKVFIKSASSIAIQHDALPVLRTVDGQK